MEFVNADVVMLEDIIKHYEQIIEKTSNMEKYGRWKKDIYPNPEGIKKYLKDGSMYLLMDCEQIAGSMAITMGQEDGYHHVDWEIDVADDEVIVIHILGVAPHCQKMGIASQMLNEAVQLARKNRKRAVRLDALASNKPARHLYEKMGFSYRGKRLGYADNTGWTDFCFYELIL